jgi:hypothetical protein
LYSSVHYAEPWLHYEVSRPSGVTGLELGFHCEARDKKLNLYLLKGLRRHLFEIKAELGESIEAEMWDRGWTKIYEVLPAAELSEEYQETVGERMAEIIVCLHPIYLMLRNDVARDHRQVPPIGRLLLEMYKLLFGQYISASMALPIPGVWLESFPQQQTNQSPALRVNEPRLIQPLIDRIDRSADKADYSAEQRVPEYCSKEMAWFQSYFIVVLKNH